MSQRVCSHFCPCLCAGPVTSEPPIYPPNPYIEKAAELDDESAGAVLAYRLLTNHWRTAECCIAERRSKLEGRNYSIANDACTFDWEAQKEAIVSYCGSQFFPSELLQSRFVRVPRGANRAAADSKRHRLKEMEQKEDENKANEDKGQAQQADANAEGKLSMLLQLVLLLGHPLRSNNPSPQLRDRYAV